MNLHTQAVSVELLGLLRPLMAIPALRPFSLAGRTALALYYGHRRSVDIDLFTERPFDSVKLAEVLTRECGLTQSSVEPNTVLGVSSGIKVDCMAHQYPLIAGTQVIGDLRLLAGEDIAAMKLNAIANRGSKKDFWDLYELMQHFSREALLSFYERKYPQANLWGVEKSLSYFTDADPDPDPVCLKGRTWLEIKAAIREWNRL